MDMPPAFGIIPGVEAVFGEKFSGEEFYEENQYRINGAAKPYRQLSDKLRQWSQDTGTAIDGKHPQRGLTREFPFPSSKRRKRSEQDFKAPSKKTTFYKVIKPFHCRFLHHADSMAGMLLNYASLYQKLIWGRIR